MSFNRMPIEGFITDLYPAFKVANVSVRELPVGRGPLRFHCEGYASEFPLCIMFIDGELLDFTCVQSNPL